MKTCLLLKTGKMSIYFTHFKFSWANFSLVGSLDDFKFYLRDVWLYESLDFETPVIF